MHVPRVYALPNFAIGIFSDAARRTIVYLILINLKSGIKVLSPTFCELLYNVVSRIQIMAPCVELWDRGFEERSYNL